MIIIGDGQVGRITLPGNVITISPANEQKQPLASIHGDKDDDHVHNPKFKFRDSIYDI